MIKKRVRRMFDAAFKMEALRRMHAALAQGHSLILFPEGNLGTIEGALLPLQSGAAYLSVHTGLPLVPVGLTGTHELWLRRPLTIRIGLPLYPDLERYQLVEKMGECVSTCCPRCDCDAPPDVPFIHQQRSVQQCVPGV